MPNSAMYAEQPEHRRRRLSSHPVAILMYHSIDPNPGEYAVTPETFVRQMEFVKRHYPVIPLTDVQRLFASPSDGIRRVAVTFDDAYVDFLDHACPVLEDLSVPCTLFVPTGQIGGRNEWDLSAGEGPERQLLTAEQLKFVYAKEEVDIGSHTVDHARMSTLPEREMRKQATQSKKALEQLLGSQIRMFSYPYGQLDDFSVLSTQVLIEEGYDVAVTTHWGTKNGQKNIMTLRRVCLSDGDGHDEMRSIIEGHKDWIAIKERVGFVYRKMKRLAGRN